MLADPTSRSRFLLERLFGEVSTPVVVLTSVAAGLLLGGATFLLARDRGSGADAEDDEGQEHRPADRTREGGSSGP